MAVTPVYTYYEIYTICKHFLMIEMFNEPDLICCTQLNSFKYW